jgi:hypothetical protein
MADCAILALALRKRFLASLSERYVLSRLAQLSHTALRLLAASAGLGVMTWLYRNSIPYDPGFWRLLERVAVPAILAIGTFSIIGSVIPLPEMGEFMPGFRKNKGER